MKDYRQYNKVVELEQAIASKWLAFEYFLFRSEDLNVNGSNSGDVIAIVANNGDVIIVHMVDIIVHMDSMSDDDVVVVCLGLIEFGQRFYLNSLSSQIDGQLMCQSLLLLS